MKIEVLNVKQMLRRKLTSEEREFYIPIFRGKSPLGNPFPVGVYGREPCIEKYKIWLMDGLKNKDQTIVTEMNKLLTLYKKSSTDRPLYLLCFCKPESCHGDFIKELLEKKVLYDRK